MVSEDSTMAAGEFKARCLEVMARVERTRRAVTITKRGRPVARLVPVDSEGEAFLGSLRGRIRIAGDLARPLDRPEAWETEKEWAELCQENPPR